MELINQKKIKARKDHVCDYCGLTIKKGSNYERSFCKYDDVYTWKNHISCSRIANVLNMYDYCDEGLTSDHFKEIVKEYLVDIEMNSLSFEQGLAVIKEKFNITNDGVD